MFRDCFESAPVNRLDGRVALHSECFRRRFIGGRDGKSKAICCGLQRQSYSTPSSKWFHIRTPRCGHCYHVWGASYSILWYRVFVVKSRRYCRWGWSGRPSIYYTILYYTTLYYTVLYYTTLHYTILYCTVLYYTTLYYTTLHYTVLYCTILHYTILYCTVLYYTILHYTRLYCTVLYYTTLHYTVLYYTMLCYAILILYYTILILYLYILVHTCLIHTYTILYYLYTWNILEWHGMVIGKTFPYDFDKSWIMPCRCATICVRLRTLIKSLQTICIWWRASISWLCWPLASIERCCIDTDSQCLA